MLKGLIAGFLAAAFLTVGSSASAACNADGFDPFTGEYGCTKPGEGEPGNPGGGGGGEPTCDLDSGTGMDSYADKDPVGYYCVGTAACFNIELFAPLALPKGEKPNEDSEARVEMCQNTVMRVYWTDSGEPSLLQQAQTAIGQITLPDPTVAISPATRTIVNLDTWFWTPGQPQTATGSSAFGLIAIAEFQSLEIQPGDGTALLSCPWTTTAEQAERDCFHEYRKASGSGAYDVTATVTYGLRFTVDGAPTTIAGAPTTLTRSSTVPLQVREVQTVVTEVR